MAIKLGKLIGKIIKSAKSPEGRAAIAVASVVLPIAAPKLAVKAGKVIAKAKVAREVVRAGS